MAITLHHIRGLLGSIFLVICCAISGCKSNNFEPEQLPLTSKQRVSYQPKKAAGGTLPAKESVEVDSLSDRFSLAQQNAYNSSTPDQLKEFLESGLNLSDYLAGRWFSGQYAKDTKARFWHDTVNTTLGVATAVVGITDGSSKSVALLGAGSVAMNNEWANYEAAYLLSSALPKVISKMKEFRAGLRDSLIKSFDAETPTYEETVRMLMNYHATASRENVKLFIEASADLAKFSTGSSTSLAENRAFVELSTKLFAALNGNAAGLYQMGDVIVLSALAATADADVTKVLSQSASNGALLTKLTAAKDTPKADALESLRRLNAIPEIAGSAANLLQKATDVVEKERASNKEGPPSPQLLAAKADLVKAFTIQPSGIRMGSTFSVQVVPVTQ